MVLVFFTSGASAALTINVSGNQSDAFEGITFAVSGTCSDSSEDLDECEWYVQNDDIWWGDTYCWFTNDDLIKVNNRNWISNANLTCDPWSWVWNDVGNPIDYKVVLRGENDDDVAQTASFDLKLHRNSEPDADAGSNMVVGKGINFTLDGTASTDTEECPTGGNCTGLKYKWYQKKHKWWDYIGSGATIQHSFSKEGKYKIGLDVEDSLGSDDWDELEVTVTKGYSCDFSEFFVPYAPLGVLTSTQENEVFEFAEEFAQKIGYEPEFDPGTGALLNPTYWDIEGNDIVFFLAVNENTPNVSINADFLVGNEEKNALLKADVWDITAGEPGTYQNTLIDPDLFESRDDSSSVSNLSLPISTILTDIPSAFARERDFLVRLSYAGCDGVLTGHSADDAYSDEYVPLGKALAYAGLNIVLIVSTAENPRGHDWVCRKFNDVTYNQDLTQTVSESGYGFVSTVGRNYWIRNISNFERLCTDGVRSNSQAIMRVTLKKNASDPGETFYNCTSNGTTFSNCTSTITVPFTSKDYTILEVSRKECGQYELYYSTNNPGSYVDLVSYDPAGADGLLIFDPDDLEISINGYPDPVFFTPETDAIRSFEVEWLTRNATINDPRIGIKINKDGPPLGITGILPHPTENYLIDGISGDVHLDYEDSQTYTMIVSNVEYPDVWLAASSAAGTIANFAEDALGETINLASPEPVTLPYGVEVAFTDKWGLIDPPKTMTQMLDVTFTPPPSDVVIVKNIWISKDKLMAETTNSLSKETEKFFVVAEIENLTKAVLSPNTKLAFYDQVSDNEIILDQIVPDEPTLINDESSSMVWFKGSDRINGLDLASEDQLVSGKNYWVRVIVPESEVGIEEIVVNDDKKVPLSIISPKKQATPEMAPLLVVMVAFAALFVMTRKKQ